LSPEFIKQIKNETLIIVSLELVSPQIVIKFKFLALFLQKSYHSKYLAIESVKESETYGALIFHKEFSTAIKKRFTLSATGDDIDNSTIKYYGDFSGNSLIKKSIC
jgi:hypothetical protein